MPAAPTPKILVVGPASAGKKTLLSRLLQQPQSTFPASSGVTLPWQLETKYYTAAVAVQLASTLEKASAVNFEAVVVVFDSSCQQSYQAAVQWAETTDLSSAEVRLLVANKADRWSEGDSGRPGWLPGAAGWACNELFEYIEACATDAALDGKLVLDEEPQGVQRIRSALQAHMWPGLVRKDCKVGLAPESMDETAAHALGVVSTAVCATSAAAAKTERTAQPVGEAADAMDGAAYPNSMLELDTVAHLSEEADMEKFEALFSELAGARNRLAAMPDDKRRETAADIASKLLLTFGLDDGSSDEEQV